MVYIIKNKDNGQYVARTGSAKSHTKDRFKAREYATLKCAKRHKCGDENIYKTRTADLLNLTLVE